ncbi:MAG: outer membrane beta-barrel protein [Bacteroidetes bacterium]|nr:outer membrane beta-barrel protein [Bacteroidota bacterium]
MKKISFILFSVFLILFFNSIVPAQSIKVGVGGGLTSVQGPDSYTNDISQNGYGFSSEYNLGAIVKVDIPLIPLTPRAFVMYHNFGGEGRKTINAPDGGLNEVDRGYSQSVLSLGAGVQYGFIPIPVGIDPYLSLDLTFNNFGDFTTTTNGSETTLEGNSRMGLQFGIGAEVSIIPTINLDVFASYSLFNISGKDDGEDTVTAFTLDLFIIFNFI